MKYTVTVYHMPTVNKRYLSGIYRSIEADCEEDAERAACLKESQNFGYPLCDLEGIAII